MPESNGGCGSARNWRGIWLLLTGQSIEEREWCKYIIQWSVHSWDWSYSTKPPGRFPGHSVHLHLVKGDWRNQGLTRARWPGLCCSEMKVWSSYQQKQLRSVGVLTEKRNLEQVAEEMVGIDPWPWTSHSRENLLTSLTLPALSVFGGLQDQPLTNKVWELEDNCSNLPTLQWISSRMCSTWFLRAPQWCWTPAVQRGSLLINAPVQLSSFSFVNYCNPSLELSVMTN